MKLFKLIIISIVVTAAKAEVDCSQRPPHLNLESCCELSNLISEEIEEKCGQNFSKEDFRSHHGPPPGPPPDHHHGPHGMRGGPHKFGPSKHCFLSCVVNETGILADGELQQEALMSYLDELFEEDEKKEFLSSTFKSCHEKHKNFDSKWPEHKHGPHHCHSGKNGMLMACVYVHAFKDCPDSFWSNTDECNEVRDHFKQCRPPFKNPDDENIGEEEEQNADEV